jgi:UDP-galactopyranose mutase
LEAANGLIHRDFMTIALVLPDEGIFPDNWIYIHDPSVNVGRIQNFRSWSPFMVKDGFTCLGLEYFVNKGDELWEMADHDLIELGKKELASLNIVDTTTIIEGHVVRMPKAYPMYDAGYQKNVDVIRSWLSTNLPNVYPVGRNGMHRYNNQDHSMLTAMLAVENMFGASNDIWSVNVDDDYHEEKKD